MKIYLLISKHLVIQLAKLQIDILSLSTTFWHCQKIPITFEQGCRCYPGRKATRPILQIQLHWAPSQCKDCLSRYGISIIHLRGSQYLLIFILWTLTLVLIYFMALILEYFMIGIPILAKWASWMQCCHFRIGTLVTHCLLLVTLVTLVTCYPAHTG